MYQNIKNFKEQDNFEYERMKISYDRIKQELSESVKNVLVEIEDNIIRDELLNILTQLNFQSVDKTVSCLLEKLVQRIRDLLLKNKRLYQLNLEQSKQIKDY